VFGLGLSVLLPLGFSQCRADDAGPRLPVPGEPAVKAARELVHDANESEFLRSPDNPEPLSGPLGLLPS